MPIVSSSLSYTASGRKRKRVRRASPPKHEFRELKSSPPTYRETKQYNSADMTKARHDLTSVASAEVKRTISKGYTVAPAYNKGAYQVISRENVKDIGK